MSSTQRTRTREHPFQIRKAAMNDGEAILTCLETAFAPYRDQYTPEAFANTVLDSEAIQHRMREMCVFIAFSRRNIVGTIGCSAHGAKGHLRGMAVLPDWQGMSLGAALLEAAEDELKKNGCQYATLDTTEPLTRAIRFYEKEGFVPSGQVSDFFGMRLYEYTKSFSTSQTKVQHLRE